MKTRKKASRLKASESSSILVEDVEKDSKRVELLWERLSSLYPNAECSLDFRGPFELIVATILSAQCTDERVNRVTPALFNQFPDAASMAAASLRDIEGLIRSTGFYRNKAKNIQQMSRHLVREHAGKVPETIEELLRLPGVGRKTANVVLGNAFGKPGGVVVDTHVKRLAYRLGLTRETNPEKVESDLNRLLPKEHWTLWPHVLIQHGRRICKARRPACALCELHDLCPRRLS